MSMKLHEHEGQWYRETGEMRLPKAGEWYLLGDEVVYAAALNDCSNRTILEKVKVVNWPHPTAWGLLSEEAQKAVRFSKSIMLLKSEERYDESWTPWEATSVSNIPFAAILVGITSEESEKSVSAFTVTPTDDFHPEATIAAITQLQELVRELQIQVMDLKAGAEQDKESR